MSLDNSPAGPLFGLRVLDYTGRMGGYCGLLLANLGAEVFLIEPPGGDRMRAEGPFQGAAFWGLLPRRPWAWRCGVSWAVDGRSWGARTVATERRS